MVPYNGNRPWNAALDAEELIEEAPGGLGRHRPSLRYWLIDESRLSESELASEPDNLAASLFRLERGRRLVEINQDVATLGELLNEPEHRELRRAFAVWLSQVLLPSRLPGVRIPAVTELWGVKTMLVENTIDWTQEWKDLGREEGRQEALQILRPAVLTLLEQRFGPLDEETRRRVETIGSGEELGDLLKRVLSASSLAELGLAS